jgi:putative transcriptional regulator
LFHIQKKAFHGVIELILHLFLGCSGGQNLHASNLQKEQARGSHPESTQNTPKSCKVVAKMKEDDFNNLVKSIKQAGKIKNSQLKPGRTFEFNSMDIKAIRNKLHKSQSEFALMIGVSVSTLQNWEQGRRKPDGPARALLKVASENPEAVTKALGA